MARRPSGDLSAVCVVRPGMDTGNGTGELRRVLVGTTVWVIARRFAPSIKGDCADLSRFRAHLRSCSFAWRHVGDAHADEIVRP